MARKQAASSTRKNRSNKKNATVRSRALPSRRFSLSLVAIFAAVCVVVGIKYTFYSQADGGYSQMCDYNYSAVQCFHVPSGSGISKPVTTTSINNDTLKEDFEQESMYRCNGGDRVTSTCPFTVGSGLNNRYLNDLIVQYAYVGDGSGGKYCLGDEYNESTIAGLQGCNSYYGTGGGPGTIFVVNIGGGGGTAGFVESNYWSNQNYKNGFYNDPGWLCAENGNNLGLNDSNGNGDLCQWHQL